MCVMKRLTVTPEIQELLKNAVGSEVSLNDIAVYEAVAFNTLPIRKRHPLYRNARAARSVLEEMAARLADESLPVLISHQNEMLPIGRVFHGKVVDHADWSELRVLFFLDMADEAARDIDLGIVDQVSVSVITKKALCSECGFDFFGPDADFENVWGGICNKGHVLGEDGVFARLVELDDWFEMSLVGRGGAQKARIVSPDQSVFGSQSIQRLAANGFDPNALILSVTPEKGRIMNFDLSKHIEEMADLKANLAIKDRELEAATKKIESLEKELSATQAKIEEMGDASAAIEERDAQIAQLTDEKKSLEDNAKAALEALKDVVGMFLTMSGDVNAEIPDDIAALSALISEKREAIKGLLVAGGTARDAISEGTKPSVGVSRAYRVNRR